MEIIYLSEEVLRWWLQILIELKIEDMQGPLLADQSEEN